MIAANLYQVNPDRNHKLWNIVSTERYILHMQVLLECSQWENWNHYFCRKVSFLTAPHCQFRGVCQGMKQTYLYLWFLYFKCKLNGIDAINEITKPRIIFMLIFLNKFKYILLYSEIICSVSVRLWNLQFYQDFYRSFFNN